MSKFLFLIFSVCFHTLQCAVFPGCSDPSCTLETLQNIESCYSPVLPYMANSTFATALRLAIQPSGWQQKLCSNTYEKYQKCVGKALDKCSCAPVTHRLNQAIFGLICDKQNYLNLNKHQFCLTDAYIHGYVEDCSDQLVELEKHPMNGCEKADRFIQCLYGINSKTCGFGEVADILSSFSDSAISAKYGLNCRNITTNGPVASYDSTVSPSESSTATAAPAAPASTTKHARKHKTTTTAQPQEITTISSGNDSVTATTAGQLIQQNLTLSTNGDILNQTESTTATAETTTQQSHLETTVVSRRKHTGKPGRRRLTLATKATPKTEINDFPVNPELLRNKVDNNSQNISESSVVISTTLRPAEVSQPNAAEVSSKSEVLQSVTNSSSSLEEISTTPSNLNATVPSFTSGVAVSKAQDPVVNSRGECPGKLLFKTSGEFPISFQKYHNETVTDITECVTLCYLDKWCQSAQFHQVSHICDLGSSGPTTCEGENTIGSKGRTFITCISCNTKQPQQRR